MCVGASVCMFVAGGDVGHIFGRARSTLPLPALVPPPPNTHKPKT